MFSAVKQALQWASLHVPMLRTLSVNDFEQLPAIAQGNQPDAWWLNIPYSLWVQDGLYHALCHAMGYAGSFWDAPSRGADSRLHLSLVLTQEFLPVSATMPASFYGEYAVRFYACTMIPHRYLRFPSGLSGLLTALTVRWGYFHGTPMQVNLALASFMPNLLLECANLARFLTPAINTAAQVSAYDVIVQTLSPALPVHKVETARHVDRLLVPYLSLVSQADESAEVVMQRQGR
jgi:hypothetical protein